MRRSVAVPIQDYKCNAKRINYQSTNDFKLVLEGKEVRANNELSLKGYLDQINGYTGDKIIALKNSKDGNDNVLYLDAINNLQLAENILNSYIQCINKDIIQRTDYTSKIYTLQQELETVRKEVEEKKQIAKEAKERSNQIKNPYNTTTWWESWFPLGRPIKKENVPVLISTSILMLVFSLGIFLRFAGMELRFESIQSNTSNFMAKANSSKYP